MIHPNDYSGDMGQYLPTQRRSLDDDSIEALLRARSPADRPEFGELSALLTQLRTVVELPAPPATSELAALLRDGVRPPARPWWRCVPAAGSGVRRRLRRPLIIAGVGSLISVPAMGVAAAQDRLPDAAQRVVARVIEITTPFTVADPPDEPASFGGRAGSSPVDPGQPNPSRYSWGVPTSASATVTNGKGPVADGQPPRHTEFGTKPPTTTQPVVPSSSAAPEPPASQPELPVADITPVIPTPPAPADVPAPAPEPSAALEPPPTEAAEQAEAAPGHATREDDDTRASAHTRRGSDGAADRSRPRGRAAQLR